MDLVKGGVRGAWYAVEARRDVLSPVVAVLLAACVAEFGNVDAVILGRRLVPPLDIRTPLAELLQVAGEDPEAAARRVAAAVGARGGRILR